MSTGTAVVGNHRTTTATTVVYHLLDSVSECPSLNITVVSRTARQTAVCGLYSPLPACRPLWFDVGYVVSVADAPVPTPRPSLSRFPLYHANVRGRYGGSAEVF